MNKGNERLMAILVALRKLPRWALILMTVGVIIVLGVAMFLLLPQPESTQGDAAYLNSTGLAFSVFLKLGVVVILIIGLAIILKRWQSKGRVTQSKQITVVETVHLSQHRTLYLISIDEKKILLGGTDQSITNLSQFDGSRPTSSSITEKPSRDFSAVLDQVTSKSDSSRITP